MRALASIVTAMLLSGCVSLNSVSLTQIPEQRKSTVKAEASKFLFFGISFDNDYVDEVRDDLRKQCSNGRITGILTKDETINYFLFIFMRKRVEAQGYCLRGA